MVLTSSEWSDDYTKPAIYINRFTDTFSELPDLELNPYTEELIKEAVVVGVALVPVFWFMRGVVRSLVPDYNPDTQLLMSVAFTGSAFHVLAEGAGLNHWYLKHSAAYMKAKQHYWERVETGDIVPKSKCKTGKCIEDEKIKHFKHLGK